MEQEGPVREEFRGKTQKTGFQEKGFDYSNIGMSGRKNLCGKINKTIIKTSPLYIFVQF